MYFKVNYPFNTIVDNFKKYIVINICILILCYYDGYLMEKYSKYIFLT